MDRIATRRTDLSSTTPSGRTFAKEFAEISKCSSDLEEEIDRALRADREFAPLLESGVRAVALFRARLVEDEFGRHPVGTLEYCLRMPTGEDLAKVQRKLEIRLSFAGSPIYKVGEVQFTSQEVVVMAMKVAIARQK